jgi:hypothetical protein
MDKKKPSVSSRFTQPYVVWPIIGALVCIVGLLAAYTVMLRGQLASKRIKTGTPSNLTVTQSPNPEQISTITPLPILTPEVVNDTVYTDAKEFTYSFEHLEGYKVIRHAGERVSIRKILPNGETALPSKGTDSLEYQFVNYFLDNHLGEPAVNRPYTRGEIFKWIEAQATGAQCYNGVTVTETTIEGVPLYKAILDCGPYGYKGIYYVELHKRNGDFLVLNSSEAEEKEHVPLFLRTFSLINP